MFSSISPTEMFIKLHHRPLVNGKGNVQQMEMFGTLGLSPPFPLRTKPPLPLLLAHIPLARVPGPPADYESWSSP